jgi:hypothetical protein
MRAKILWATALASLLAGLALGLSALAGAAQPQSVRSSDHAAGQTVDGTLNGAGQTLGFDGLGQVTGGVGAQVQDLTQAVNGTVNGAGQAVGGAVNGAGQAVDGTVNGTNQTVHSVVDTANGTVGSVTDHAAGTVGGGTNGISASAANLHDAASSAGAASTAVTHAASSAGASAPAAGVTHHALATHDTLAGLLAPGPVAGATPSGGRSLEDILSAIGGSHELPYAAAGVIGMVALGFTAARFFTPMVECSGGPVPLFMNSVRLLPCTASHAVGGASDAVGESFTKATDSIGKATTSAADAVKTGFNEVKARAGVLPDAIRRDLQEGGSGAGDNRLLLQLGMLLGFGYIAFLTIWLWATRVRRYGVS